ncbi:MAG: hypothetical protein ACI9GO_000594, partial [Bacteroidia bacterium]
ALLYYSYCFIFLILREQYTKKAVSSPLLSK